MWVEFYAMAAAVADARRPRRTCGKRGVPAAARDEYVARIAARTTRCSFGLPLGCSEVPRDAALQSRFEVYGEVGSSDPTRPDARLSPFDGPQIVHPRRILYRALSCVDCTGRRCAIRLRMRRAMASNLGAASNSPAALVVRR